MDIDPDTFLTTVYAEIDAVCQAHPPAPRRGPHHRMSDSEVLTLMVLGHWHGTSERGMLAWIQATYAAYFPVVLSPSAFNRRARRLATRMAALMHHLARQLKVWEEWFEIVDGLAVPVAQRVRGQRHKCFLPEEAGIGCGGAGKAMYYGVSLLVCVTGSGVITGCVTSPANNAERWALGDLLAWRQDPTAIPLGVEAIASAARHGRTLVGPVGHRLSPTTAGEVVTGVYLADRGFTGADWAALWTEAYHAEVITQDHLPTPVIHWFQDARQRIETVNGVLTDVLHVRFPRARTEHGLITRLVGKCAAVNLGILINRLYQRPDLAHGTLFRG